MTRTRMNFNNLEKAVEGDYNKIQQLLNLMYGEEARFAYGTEMPARPLGAATHTQQDVPIVHGLQVGQGGNASTVSVSPGVLLQYNAALTPTPASFETAYRQGLITAPATVNLPTPGAVTYALLQARVRQLVVNESRQFLNTTTKAFFNQNAVKEHRYDIEFSWVLGTSTQFPAAGQAGWVVIAGVVISAANQVVNYPASANAIMDFRPRPRQKIGYDKSAPAIHRIHTSTLGNVQSSDVNAHIVASAISSEALTANPNGGISMRLWADNQLDVNLNLNAWRAGASPAAFVGSTWYYVYLAPWNGVAPRFRTGNGMFEGIPIVTTVPPNKDDTNSASLTPGQPFSNVSVNTGQAKCIAAFWRNPANTGFASMHGNNSMLHLGQTTAQTPTVVASQTSGASMSVTMPASMIPRNARRIRIRITGEAATAGSIIATTFVAIGAHDSGQSLANPLYDAVEAINVFPQATLATTPFTAYAEIPAPVNDLVAFFQVQGSFMVAISLRILLVGYSI